MKKLLDETIDLTNGCFIGDVAYTGFDRSAWAKNNYASGKYGKAIIGNTSMGDFCEETEITTTRRVSDHSCISSTVTVGALAIDVGNLSVVDATAVTPDSLADATRLMLYYKYAYRVKYRVYECKDYYRHEWLVYISGEKGSGGEDVIQRKIAIRS